VQGKLAEKELSLIVWDCYRPKRAVDDFLQWSKDPAHSEMKTEFYPRTDREKLFALEYLAKPSADVYAVLNRHFPLVCAENLSAGIVVVKSAKDGV